VVNYLLISGEAGQVGKNLVMPVEASLSMLLQAENKQEKATIKKATLLFQKKKRTTLHIHLQAWLDRLGKLIKQVIRTSSIAINSYCRN